MNKEIRVNFVIVGAQKSGTTSIHKYLSWHNDIFMTTPLKEPGFFLPIEISKKLLNKSGFEFDNREELFEKYMTKGFSNETIFGESSTFYTLGTYAEKYSIPERIWDYNDKVKLLYIIRNPIDRIVSNYKHALERDYISLNCTLNRFIETDSFCLKTTLYNYQLSRYLNRFDNSQLHIVKFEDLVVNPLGELNKILDFLNLSRFQNAKIGEFQVFNKSSISNEKLSLSINKEFLREIEESLLLLHQYIPFDINDYFDSLN